MAAFYALHIAGGESIQTGLLVVDTPQLDPRRLRDFKCEQADNELDLLNMIVDTVVELDPDIVTGWEIQKGSWGYVAARGQSYGVLTSVR